MAAGGSLQRPAFYALRPGGWRDLLSLMHPPYTAWHLSYVALGAAVAPDFQVGRLAWGLRAFFLGVGVCAHALDELHGRPLGTKLSTATLRALAAASLAGGIGDGGVGGGTGSATGLPVVGWG